MRMNCLLIYLLLLIAGCGTPKEIQKKVTEENTLLWRITGKQLSQASYLYGTIHMICKEDFVLSDALKLRFDSAAMVYLELDLDDPAMMLKTMKLSMMKDKSLKDLFSKEDYDKLNLYMRDSVGMPLLLFNKMKPITLMSLLYTKALPCDKQESYEQRFLQMAQSAKKEIKGLESLEDQFAVFDKIPDSVQAKMIMEMINAFGSQRQQFQQMTEAYKKQDLAALHRQISASPDIAGYEDVFLVNRNKNWIPVMEDAMKKNSNFFAVGAGHLPGENGVINLLRKAGYTLTPVK